MLAKSLVGVALAGGPLLGLVAVAQGEIVTAIRGAADFVTIGLLLLIAYNGGRMAQKVTGLCTRMDRVEKHFFGE